MNNGKTDQTTNGTLHKRQSQVVPKGQRMHYIEELRLYIIVSKKLSDRAVKVRERKLIERYAYEQTRYFKTTT
jgi:hypothetical protein